MARPRLTIRTDLADAADLCRLARREPRRRTMQRLLALANALDGMSRADAARAAGIERQALRDAVVRYNAEGSAGLGDRPAGRRPDVSPRASRRCLSTGCCAGPIRSGASRRAGR